MNANGHSRMRAGLLFSWSSLWPTQNMRTRACPRQMGLERYSNAFSALIILPATLLHYCLLCKSRQTKKKFQCSQSKSCSRRKRYFLRRQRERLITVKSNRSSMAACESTSRRRNGCQRKNGSGIESRNFNLLPTQRVPIWKCDSSD